MGTWDWEWWLTEHSNAEIAARIAWSLHCVGCAHLDMFGCVLEACPMQSIFKAQSLEEDFDPELDAEDIDADYFIQRYESLHPAGPALDGPEISKAEDNCK